jgi:hypothetical protein
LEAVAVVVRERELGAGCGRSRRAITRDPAGQVEAVGELGDLPLLRGRPSASSAGIQAASESSRIAALTGSVSS